MDIVLGPDVYVNASVAPGTPPDKVVNRILGQKKAVAKASPWILDRVRAMLAATGVFKPDAVDKQIELIKGLVSIVDDPETFAPDAWAKALTALALQTGAKRVITDHPDLVESGGADGVEFISSEAWMLEQALPPPPPPVKPKS
jgi:hypothetical protein